MVLRTEVLLEFALSFVTHFRSVCGVAVLRSAGRHDFCRVANVCCHPTCALPRVGSQSEKVLPDLEVRGSCRTKGYSVAVCSDCKEHGLWLRGLNSIVRAVAMIVGGTA